MVSYDICCERFNLFYGQQYDIKKKDFALTSSVIGNNKGWLAAIVTSSNLHPQLTLLTLCPLSLLCHLQSVGTQKWYKFQQM